MLIEAAQFDISPNLVDLKELSDLVTEYRAASATRPGSISCRAVRI